MIANEFLSQINLSDCIPLSIEPYYYLSLQVMTSHGSYFVKLPIAPEKCILPQHRYIWNYCKLKFFNIALYNPLNNNFSVLFLVFYLKKNDNKVIFSDY